MFLLFLFYFCASWGPIFHQLVAQEFAHEYLSHLTAKQARAFIQGSVFVDGLSRKQYHNLSNLLLLLKEYDSKTSLEYYFVLGFILHMTADSSGHIGSKLSFLPMKVPLHYFAELTVCSAIFHSKKVPSISHDEISESVFQRTRKGTSLFFGIFYKIWRIVVRFPFYHFLSSIQNDDCSRKNDKKFAMCNLLLHIEAIKRSMYDTLLYLHEGNLTSESIGQLTIKELKTFQCCK